MSEPPLSLRTRVAVAVLLVVAGNAVVLAFDVGRVLGADGTLRFFDQDSYTRLLRLRELLAGSGWYDTTLAALNAPAGLSMHWSRALDLLLLPPVLVLAPLVGETAALAWSGFLVGPVLEVAALLVLLSALPPGRGRSLAVLACGLFVVQRTVGHRFAVGQADHHHLIVLLHVATLLPLLAAAHPGRRLSATVLAGAAAAAGLWVSPGGVITLAAALLALGAAWLLDGDARDLRRFGTGLLAAAVAALVVERPPADWLTVEYDRFSIVHVVLAGVVFVAARALACLPGRWPSPGGAGGRALAAGLVAALAGGALLALFPAIGASPLAAYDGDLSAWLRDVGELRVSLPRTPAQVPAFVFDMAPALVALLWAATRLAREQGAVRRRRVLEVTMLAVLMVAAMYLLRAQELLLAIAPLAWAEALLAVSGGVGAARRLAGAAGAVLLVAASWVGGYGWAALGGLDVRKPEGCDYERVAPALVAATHPGQVILADVNAGPEVAWRTGRGVLAALYHRNLDGMRDARAMYLSAGDDAGAREVAARRDVGAVVFCRRLSAEDAATLRVAPQILYSRLLTARVPAWLAPVPVPPEVAGQFAVFAVRERSP